MGSRRAAAVLFAAAVVLACQPRQQIAWSAPTAAPPPAAPEAPAGPALRPFAAPARLVFERNAGQLPRAVAYRARGAGADLFVLGDGRLVLGVARPTRPLAPDEPGAFADPRVVPVERVALVLEAVRPAGAARLEPGTQLAGRIHVYQRRLPRRWRTDVLTFESVRLRGAAPGVDLVYAGEDGALALRFAVAGGADPGRATLRYRGAHAMRVATDGALVVEAAGTRVVHERPRISEGDGPARRELRGVWVVADGAAHVRVDGHAPAAPLAISTRIAFADAPPAAGDLGTAIAVWREHVHVVGATSSALLPRVAPGKEYAGGWDAFVLRMTRDGRTVESTTILGGRGADLARAVAVDGDGRIHVAGETSSTDFPVAGRAAQWRNAGGTDAFVTTLGPDGRLLWSTYLGGPDDDRAWAVALVRGAVWVGGETRSAAFRAVFPRRSGRAAGTDGFVAGLGRDGDPVFLDRLGGSGWDEVRALAGGDGGAVAAGATGSYDFRTSPGAPRTEVGGPSDAFAVCLAPDGTVRGATLLGGSGEDEALGVALARGGEPVLAGFTTSRDFPVDAPSPLGRGDGRDAFVARLAPDCGRLLGSTAFGGAAGDVAHGIAVDGAGNESVIGSSASGGFLAVGEDGRARAVPQLFLTRLGRAGAVLDAVAHAGASPEEGLAVALDADGAVYGTGRGASPGALGAGPAAARLLVVKLERPHPPR
jgi:Beta-propeller repeat